MQRQPFETGTTARDGRVLAIAAALALTASCGGSSGSRQHDCQLLAGTALTLNQSAFEMNDCGYMSDGSNAWFHFAGPGQTLDVVLSGQPTSGTYAVSDSTIPDAIDAAQTGTTTWSMKEALKHTVGAPSGTAMVTIRQVDMQTGAFIDVGDSGSGGQISIKPAVHFPNNIGESAATAMDFEAVPLRPRSSGTGPPTLTLGGTAKTAVGASSTLKECAPDPGIVSGGARCVDFQTSGLCYEGPDGGVVGCSCKDAICTVRGKCCLLNKHQCGGAGGGGDCCSGFCNSEEKCDTPKPATECGLAGLQDGGSSGGPTCCYTYTTSCGVGCVCYPRGTSTCSPNGGSAGSGLGNSGTTLVARCPSYPSGCCARDDTGNGDCVCIGRADTFCGADPVCQNVLALGAGTGHYTVATSYCP